MRTTLPDCLLLAAKFSKLLRKYLGAGKVAEVIERNKSYTDDCCASHDFCDANTVMAEAWENLSGAQIDLRSEVQIDIWNRAWAAAKASEFNR